MREWDERFAPLLTGQLRARWRCQAGRSRYVDETYVKVHGRWRYLYRAIDRAGILVDARLSETRGRKAVQRCFRGARPVVGPHSPDAFVSLAELQRLSHTRWAALKILLAASSLDHSPE